MRFKERAGNAVLRAPMRRVMILAGCVAALGMVPSAALATPGSGVTGTVLATGTSAETLKVKTKGPVDVVVRTITIAPGGSTGWHHHTGQLIAVVQQGTLTRTLQNCSVERTTAGQSFIEPSGAKHRHIGRNLGSTPVVLYVTYMLPAGSPLSVDSDAPECATGKAGKSGGDARAGEAGGGVRAGDAGRRVRRVVASGGFGGSG